MKKPVRKTKVELEEIASRRAYKTIRRQVRVPSGNIAKFDATLIEFCRKWGVRREAVRVTGYYYSGSYLVADTQETDAERLSRVRKAENERYRVAKYRYDAWQSQQKQSSTVVINNNCTCPSTCCCRRSQVTRDPRDPRNQFPYESRW